MFIIIFTLFNSVPLPVIMTIREDTVCTSDAILFKDNTHMGLYFIFIFSTIMYNTTGIFVN